MYRWPNVIEDSETKKGTVARHEKVRKYVRISVGISVGKRPLGKLRSRW